MRNGNLIQLCSGRYYQGSGVLSHLGGDAVLLGRRALVVGCTAVWPKVEARVLRSLEQSGVDTKYGSFPATAAPAMFEVRPRPDRHTGRSWWWAWAAAARWIRLK